MISQEEIGIIIFKEVMKVQEELGEDIAFAFLSGIQFATKLQADLLAKVFEQNSPEIASSLGEFYSEISKGEIN